MNFGALANAGASGFLEGARTAAEIQNAQANQERQKRADELAQQHLEADTALKNREYALRENEYAQNESFRQAQLANQAAQQNRQTELHQGALELYKRQQDLVDLKMVAEQNEQNREQGKQAILNFQAMHAADPTWTPPPEALDKVMQQIGAPSMAEVMHPDMLNAIQIANDFASGKRTDFNSKDALEGIAKLWPQMKTRGIGEPITYTDESGQVVKGKIAEKEPYQIIVDPNGPKDQPLIMALKVRVAGEDGKMHEYFPPTTVHGTSHPEDPILHFHPEAPIDRAAKIAAVRAFMEDTFPQLAQAYSQKPTSALDQEQIKETRARTGLIKAQTEKTQVESQAAASQGKPWNEKAADGTFSAVFAPAAGGTDTQTAADYVASRFLGQKIPEGETIGSVAMSKAKQDSMFAHGENPDIPQDTIDRSIATGRWTAGNVPGKGAYYGYETPNGQFLAVKPYNKKEGDIAQLRAASGAKSAQGAYEPSVLGFAAETAGRAAGALKDAFTSKPNTQGGRNTVIPVEGQGKAKEVPKPSALQLPRIANKFISPEAEKIYNERKKFEQEHPKK